MSLIDRGLANTLPGQEVDFIVPLNGGVEQPNDPTMSSREIAELTAKRHDNVRADIEKIARELSLTFQEKLEPSEGGRPSKIYLLGKRECLILVSGYSVELRARIIDRWMELEAAQSHALSPAEILIAQGNAMLAVEQRQLAIGAKQAEQDRQIAEQERRLNQIETATDYFTAVGYARWAKQQSIDLKTAAELGRRASKRCKAIGIPTPKIPDPRFGAVCSYPKQILDAAWDELFGPPS